MPSLVADRSSKPDSQIPCLFFSLVSRLRWIRYHSIIARCLLNSLSVPADCDTTCSACQCLWREQFVVYHVLVIAQLRAFTSIFVIN